MVRKATNNELWGPSGTEMSKIADLTHHFTEYRQIMDALWARLSDKTEGRNWRQIYKSLLLMDYLLKNGSEKVIAECRHRIYELKCLQKFHYVDEKDVDHGLSVRERSKNLCELIVDNDRLREERSNAARSRAKYSESISSDGHGNYSNNASRGHSANHYGGGGNRGKKTFDNYDDDPLPNKEDWDPFPGGRAQKPASKPARKVDFDDDDDDDWDAAFAKKDTASTTSQPKPAQAAPQPQPTAKPAQPVHQATPVPTPTAPFNPFDNVSTGSLLGGGTSTTTQPSNSTLLGGPLLTPSTTGLLGSPSQPSGGTSFNAMYGNPGSTLTPTPNLSGLATPNYVPPSNTYNGFATPTNAYNTGGVYGQPYSMGYATGY